MRWLLAMLIGVIVFSDIMSWQMSLAPGLSVKNAALYALMFAMVFRAALRGVRGIELPGLHVIFGLWMSYGIATWLLAALFIHYPHYQLIPNALTLKSELIDSVMYFLVAFHCLGDEADVRLGFKALAAAVGIANFATLADVMGLTHLGITIGRSGAEEGRVFGVFGHANDTAALIDCLLPIGVAVAVTTRGWERLLWIGGALCSLAVLLLTVSRGAYVGVALGGLWAAWLCRRYVSLPKMAAWAFVGGVAVVAAVAVASLAVPHVGELILSRLLGGGGDVSQASSGRTEVWMEVLNRMIENPITLFTGYGWDVYWVMPFRFATHNYYLYLWFNLGVVGLLSFIAIIAIGVNTARRAIETASQEFRSYHIALVFGLLMLAIAVFFGNLGGHWQLVWIYLGVSLRAALLSLESPESVHSRQRASLQPEPLRMAGVRIAHPHAGGPRPRGAL